MAWRKSVQWAELRDRRVKPHEKVIVEVDGYTFHGKPRDYEMTARRHALLAGAGWRVIRVTPMMIREAPELVLDTIRSALWRRHQGVLVPV